MIRILYSIIICSFICLFGCKNSPSDINPVKYNSWPTEQWKLALQQELGLNPQKLLQVETYLKQYPTEAFLVTRYGSIAFEGYYNGFTRDQLHNSYSIAKCFTSTAIGAAIQNGDIPSTHTKLADFIPADQAATPNPQYYDQITIQHLLTMTSGIDFSNREHYHKMTENNNWAQYVLQRPILHAPGSHWKYKADPTILSAIISKAAGKNMFEYSKEHIFDVIGIDNIRWDADPDGNTSGNGDVHTTARNYARLGLLMLGQGSWSGKALLPADWAAQSTSPCKLNKRSHCDCWSEIPMQIDPEIPIEYGYAWWCRRFPGVPNDAYYAFGGLGQFILVIPSLDIVAVRLANDKFKSDEVVLPEMARLIVQAVKNDSD